MAEISPATVLTGATPRLLDEWQSVPGLWDAVRAEVDTRNAKGQFILTGSATPQRKGDYAQRCWPYRQNQNASYDFI
ncbi:MAG: AAA family ATPase [Lentisphaeria bacterium]|nr:MAG: AAA family ATPase [Lentisphaeria bacterium]